jgi:response regulator RpfG family c-di-GMP phosphodiesterase
MAGIVKNGSSGVAKKFTATEQTILLVEDEVIIAMQEKMVLERAGYRVVTATSGEEAVHLALTTPDLSLVLMGHRSRGGNDRYRGGGDHHRPV